MSPETIQNMIRIKRPIMYWSMNRTSGCHGVCLNCNKCFTDEYYVFSDRFISTHTSPECLKAWPEFEPLFTASPHVTPNPLPTPIQNVVTYAEPRPETQYKKSVNSLSDSTVENLRAWARHCDEDSDVPDELVGYLLDSEAGYAERLEQLNLQRLHDIGRHYGLPACSDADALDALIEKVEELQAQVDSRHM
jgi:hypothetical protein